MRAAAAVFLAALLGTAASARAATVSLTIEGVRNDRGQVLVTLCTRADFLRPHCPWKAQTKAHAGSVMLTIDDVPPGIYAAQAFHDENMNFHLDRSLLGMPLEGMGFSNNAVMHFGPPNFDHAAFTLGAAGVRVAFRLRYF